MRNGSHNLHHVSIPPHHSSVPLDIHGVVHQLTCLIVLDAVLDRRGVDRSESRIHFPLDLQYTAPTGSQQHRSSL